MPVAVNARDGVRINYEVHGRGTPLMLLHGGGGSLERWHELGYVRALGQMYTVVLVDARGHGKSDHPRHAASYRYEQFVSDLVTVLDHAGIDHAHFLGYSLGGLVGFRIPIYAPGRFISLTLGGAHPYAQFSFWEHQFQSFRDGLEGYVRKRERLGKAISEEEFARLQSADLTVYAAVGEALREEPGAIGYLHGNTTPMLMFCGDGDTTDGVNDRLPEAADRIPNSVLLTVCGCDHRDLLPRLDHVVPAVLSFHASVGIDVTAYAMQGSVN